MPGNIIIRQRGTQFHPGQNVCVLCREMTSICRSTCFALCSGRHWPRPYNIRSHTRICALLQAKVATRGTKVCWCGPASRRKAASRRSSTWTRSLLWSCKPQPCSNESANKSDRLTCRCLLFHGSTSVSFVMAYHYCAYHEEVNIWETEPSTSTSTSLDKCL